MTAIDSVPSGNVIMILSGQVMVGTVLTAGSVNKQTKLKKFGLSPLCNTATSRI